MATETNERLANEVSVLRRRITELEVDAEKSKRLEELLKASDRRHKAIGDCSKSWMWEVDNSGILTYVSDQVMDLLGYAPQEMVGKRPFEFQPPDDAARMMSIFAQHMENPRPLIGCPNICLRKDGQPISMELHSTPLFDSEKNLAGFCGVNHDVTELRQSQEHQGQLSSLLQAALESTADGLLVVDNEGRFSGRNSKFAEMWRLPQNILNAGDDHKALQYVLDQLKDPQGFLDKVEGLYADREAESFDILEFKDGRVFERYSKPQKIGYQIVGRVWSFRDITQRVRAEAALRESEERFQFAMRGATDGLWDWNLKTDQVYFSPRWKSMLGYAPEELGENLNTWKTLVDPEDMEPTLAQVQALIEGRSDKYEVEFRMRHKDGHYRHILSRAFLVHDQNGVAVRLVGTHVDLTGKKQAEDALRRSEEFVRSILDSVDEGFLVVDRDYRIVAVNKAYCESMNASRDEIVGKHCYQISHRSARPCYETGENCATKHTFETGEPSTALHKHEDAQGNIVYVETKAFPLKDNAGCTTSVIETIHDITERYLLEAEQLKTQKLEAVGTLAGGIAHDFNNLLQGVFGYISMAKMHIAKPADALELLSQAEEALGMSVNLTTQLLTFSKGGKPVKRSIALLPALENAVKFALSGSRSDYRISKADDLWPVEADEGQIGQVIQNIVLNASEATPGGGTIAITLRNVEIPAGSKPALRAGGKFVEIAITDSGAGISREHLARIFDPYFTTKTKGNGLGLATSYSIVRNHQGTIDVSSEVGKGSTFCIFLPAAEAAAEPQAASPGPAAGRKGRVLIMDDEEMVRAVASRMIRALGHEVECAAHGEEAIEKVVQARATERPYDVAILDLTVRGGMGGESAVKRLLEIDRELKAIVSSGYGDSPILADYRSYGFAAILGKPYRIESLGDILNSLLAE